MSLPKEPRQLMINLMYLVLTALLAMNVSSEILNAFKTIGKSIDNSNKTADARNKGVTEMFDKYQEDPKAQADKKQKVKEALELAKQVNAKTDALVAQIESYKQMIIAESGGLDDKGEIKRIDDLDAGTRVMIEQGNGAKLLKSLKDYKNEVSGLVPIDNSKMIASGTNKEVFDQLPLNFDTDKTDDNPSGDWSFGNFHMSPTIANKTLLDKYISDVRACQSVALDNIWSLATGEVKNRPQVITAPKTFNDYAIIVSADNSYMLPGEKYHARIMMGTYNKSLKNLSFNVNGRTISPVNGIADFSEVASAVGQKNVNVTATFTDSVVDAQGNKSVETRTVKIEKPQQYFVGEAQASISLDKMNVFYIGVDNPITISASGVPAGSIVVTPEGCTLTKDATGVNQYQVRATTQGKAYISLSAKLSDGTVKNFGKKEYRVKRIPDPRAQFAGKYGGAGGANELKSQLALFAKLEGFDFDAKFNVVSYDLFYQPKRGEPKEASSNTMYTNGPNADADVRAIMDKLKPGDKLFFDNIRAKGPDGTTRSIGTLMYNINS